MAAEPSGDGRRVVLTVEIEPDSEPIRGAVRGTDGARPFHGWIQLTELIEAARRTRQEAPP